MGVDQGRGEGADADALRLCWSEERADLCHRASCAAAARACHGTSARGFRVSRVKREQAPVRTLIPVWHPPLADPSQSRSCEAPSSPRCCTALPSDGRPPAVPGLAHVRTEDVARLSRANAARRLARVMDPLPRQRRVVLGEAFVWPKGPANDAKRDIECRLFRRRRQMWLCTRVSGHVRWMRVGPSREPCWPHQKGAMKREPTSQPEAPTSA